MRVYGVCMRSLYSLTRCSVLVERVCPPGLRSGLGQ